MVKLLPPGFRFHPTDQELVVQYLKRKVESFPLPASIIPDLDVCKSDPWDLPGDSGKERYFFSTREAKYPNGNRSNRATISGYWKATGKDKPVPLTTSQVLRGGGGGVVVAGMKKTLVFYRGKPPHGQRTDWIMHEYRLVPDSLSSTSLSLKTTLHRQAKGDWVLCRIFLKKRNNAVSGEDGDDKEQQQQQQEKMVCDYANKEHSKITDNTTTKMVFYGLMGPDLNLPAAPSSSSSSSSSGSSAVTQTSSTNNNDSSEEREESSSCLSTITRKP